MKISIITINLNNADGLNKTINSVISQTYPDIEYIIIDGASTDCSVKKIKASEKSLHYWISEKDNGMYEAMNKGILRSTGDYLLFLNSGDTFLNDVTLQNAIKEFSSEDIIYGNIQSIAGDNTFRKELYPDILNLSFFITGAIPHQGMFIKKTAFSIVGLYSEKLKICSDWKFQIDSICKFKCSYKHINQTIANFPGNGISSLPENQSIITKEKESVLINEYFFLKEDLQLYLEYKRLAFYYHHSNRIKLLQKLKVLKPILSGRFIFNYNT